MADVVEKIETILTADVSGLERGIDRAEKAFKRLGEARKQDERLQKANAVMGDLQGSLARLGALAPRVFGAIGAAGAAAFVKARGEAVRFSAVIDGMTRDATALTTRLSSLSRESGIGELSEQYRKARELSRQFREEEARRTSTSQVERAISAGGRGYNNLKDFLTPGRSIGDTNAEQRGQAELASKSAIQAEARTQRLITESLAQQAQLAEATAAGRTDEAAVIQLQVQRQRELNELASVGLKTEANVAEVNAKYEASVRRVAEDRARIVRDAEAEAEIAEALRRGETERAARLQQSLQFTKARESVMLSGGTAGQQISLTRTQDAQGRLLRETQAFDRARASSSLQSARVGGDLSLGDSQRTIIQAGIRLDFLRKELTLRKGLTDEQRRGLEIDAQQTQNELRRARSAYRTQQGGFSQRNRELDITQNITLGAAEKEIELSKSKIGYLAQELRTRTDLSQEVRQQYQIEIREERERLALAQARQRTELDAFAQRKREQQIQGTNQPLKQLSAATSHVSFLRGQLNRKDINADERRSLELELGSAQNDVRQSRQDAFFEYRNRPGDLNAAMAKARRDQTERDKFDARMEASGGLQSLHRDMNGNPISGIDPATGQRVAFGQGTQPLTAGQAAQQMAGSKEFLGSKASPEQKLLTVQVAALESLKSIDKALTAE